MTRPSDPIRRLVADQYARLASADRTAAFADPITNPSYSASDLEALPDDAEGSSFGCGNPFAFAGIEPGDSVVDLGSGAGLDLLLAAEHTGPSGRVIGIDMTDELIAKARSNIEKAGVENIEVRKGFIEALPIESASINWVISNCVVNLSPDKAQVFGEIARVLRPGGRMLISDIVANDVRPWMRALVRPFNPSVAGAISESAYVRGLERAGLEEVEIVDRLVYDEASIRSMIQTELNAGEDKWLRKRLIGLLAPPLVRAAAGRVVSIRVAATRAAKR